MKNEIRSSGSGAPSPRHTAPQRDPELGHCFYCAGLTEHHGTPTYCERHWPKIFRAREQARALVDERIHRQKISLHKEHRREDYRLVRERALAPLRLKEDIDASDRRSVGRCGCRWIIEGLEGRAAYARYEIPVTGQLFECEQCGACWMWGAP